MTRFVLALAGSVVGCNDTAAPTLPAPILIAVDDAPLPGIVPDDATFVLYRTTSIIADDTWVYWSAVVMYLVPGEITDFHCNTYHSWIKRAPRAGGATEVLAEVDDYVGSLARGARGLYWSQSVQYCDGPTLVTLDLPGGTPQPTVVSASFMPYPFVPLFDDQNGVVGIGTEPGQDRDSLYAIDPTGDVAPVKLATLDVDDHKQIQLTPAFFLSYSDETNVIHVVSRANPIVFGMYGFRKFGAMAASGNNLYWADNDYPGLPAQLFAMPLAGGTTITLVDELPDAQVTAMSADDTALWAKVQRGSDTSLLGLPLAGGATVEYPLPSYGGFTDIGGAFLMTDGAGSIVLQPKPPVVIGHNGHSRPWALKLPPAARGSQTAGRSERFNNPCRRHPVFSSQVAGGLTGGGAGSAGGGCSHPDPRSNPPAPAEPTAAQEPGPRFCLQPPTATIFVPGDARPPGLGSQSNSGARLSIRRRRVSTSQPRQFRSAAIANLQEIARRRAA